MPCDLLEQEDIVKKNIYNPRDPIATVFFTVEELLKFADITMTSYTQLQAFNIAYVILHQRGKFRLDICEWNCMPAVQKTWAHFFCTSNKELRETSNLTVEDAGMHHANMVRDILQGYRKTCNKIKLRRRHQ